MGAGEELHFGALVRHPRACWVGPFAPPESRLVGKGLGDQPAPHPPRPLTAFVEAGTQQRPRAQGCFLWARVVPQTQLSVRPNLVPLGEVESADPEGPTSFFLRPFSCPFYCSELLSKLGSGLKGNAASITLPNVLGVPRHLSPAWQECRPSFSHLLPGVPLFPASHISREPPQLPPPLTGPTGP